MSTRRRRGRGGPAGEECLDWKQPIMKVIVRGEFPGGVSIDPGRVNGSNAGRTIPALDHRETKIKGEKQKLKKNSFRCKIERNLIDREIITEN